MDYVTSKSLVNQRCKIAEKYLAKLKYLLQKSEKKMLKENHTSNSWKYDKTGNGNIIPN
jgi:hypothetical protein